MPPKRGRGRGGGRGGAVQSTRKRKADDGQPETPTHSHGILLDDHVATAKQTHKEISNQEIIDHLNKITSERSIESSNKRLSIKIIVSSSEGDYLIGENNARLNELQETFKTSLKVSDKINGLVERTLTITGDLKQISKTALYVSFLLLKLNNFTSKFIHANSSSFHLNLLINSKLLKANELKLSNVAERCDIVLDVSTMSYNFSSNRSIYIKGNFPKLLDFILVLIESLDAYRVEDYGTEFPIMEFPITGTYGNPNSFNVQETNKNVLNKSLKQLWESLYPVKTNEVTSTDFIIKKLKTSINEIKSTYLSSSTKHATIGGHGFNNNLGNGGVNSQSQVIKTLFEVPTDLTGQILGKNGTSINEIRSKTNCNIKLLDKNPSSTDEEFRVLEFNGLPETIMNALAMILELFDE